MSHQTTTTTPNASMLRSIPSQGYNNPTAALSLTLTSEQVEALFTRLMPTMKKGGGGGSQESATQFPAEIDFRNGKIYIGNTIFSSFSVGEESGVCKMSRRSSPSTSHNTKQPGSSTSVPIIGRITLNRELDDAVANLRKATEAANAKKNERGIIRIDAPIATGRNGKKTSTPRPTTNTLPKNPSKSTEFTNPPSSSIPTISSTQTPDFRSLRSRVIHAIAIAARPEEVTISDFLITRRSTATYNDTEAAVRRIFYQVAQVIPGPKGSDPADLKWDLKAESWLEVRPFGFPDYTPEERTQASRRARVYSRISPQHPVWEHFSMPVDRAASSNANVKNSKPATKSIMPKRKTASKPKAAEKKEPASKPTRPPKGSGQKRKLAELELDFVSDMEEGEIQTKGPKRRKISGTPDGVLTFKQEHPVWEHCSMPVDSPASSTAKNSQPATKSIMTKKKTAPKPKVVEMKEPLRPPNGSGQKRKLAELELDFVSDLEEGEIPTKGPKRRKISGTLEGALASKQGGSVQRVKAVATVSSQQNNSERCDEKERGGEKGKGKEKAVDKESGRGRGKRKMEDGELDDDEERPPFKCSRIDDDRADRIKADKGDKGPPPRVKRKRRLTPIFTSDEEEGEIKPPKPAAIPNSKTTSTNATTSTSTSTTTITSTTTTTSVNMASPKTSVTQGSDLLPDPDTLPNDKASLQHAYGRYYAHYLLIMSAFYTEQMKVETAFALHNDIEEESDLMDVKTLSEMCQELHWTKIQLERLRKAHAALDANAV